jgi:hypothetical protein
MWLDSHGGAALSHLLGASNFVGHWIGIFVGISDHKLARLCYQHGIMIWPLAKDRRRSFVLTA